MRARAGGWLLASLAVAVAVACIAIAVWGATGRFDRSQRAATAADGQAIAPVDLTPMLGSSYERFSSMVGAYHPVGTCLAHRTGADGSSGFERVDCDVVHLFEMVASIDLGGLPDSYPSFPVWNAIVSTCVASVEQYTGSSIGYDQVPAVGAVPFSITTKLWEQGVRLVPCAVVELGPNGLGVERTGRLRA